MHINHFIIIKIAIILKVIQYESKLYEINLSYKTYLLHPKLYYNPIDFTKIQLF